MPGC